MSFNNIPIEMRAYRQWVCWRYEEGIGNDATKVPYSPHSAKPASVANPDSWGSFDEAVKAAAQWYNGIGFVLTADDPYGFIDLDDTAKKVAAGQLTQEQANAIIAQQHEIYQAFSTYSEYSPSGKGLHLILKGKVEAGRRRSCIEIYSQLRFMTMTGNVYNNALIENKQELLTELWNRIGGGVAQHYYDPNAPEIGTDQEILSQAFHARNGDKFWKLWNAEWTGLFGSASEADLALIDILAFYTQNKKQILRMYRTSPAGQQPKPPYLHRADRVDYVERMILRSFDRMLPPIDLDGITNQIEMKLEEERKLSPIALPPGSATQQLPATIALPMIQQPMLPGLAVKLGKDQLLHLRNAPPGLLGEIANFIYDASPRQVPEIALVGAIGLMAGICGRAYNIIGSGLNQYVLFLGVTGTGKEGMASGFHKLLAQVSNSVTKVYDFVGPSEIQSSPALLKELARRPCFVSVVGEFGLRLKQMSSNGAPSHETGLRRTLLDLWNKSGHGQVAGSMSYSDSGKNTIPLAAPNFTILGESTPERFYEALEESMITEGLLPRFTIIEYRGTIPDLNYNFVNAVPSDGLVAQVCTLAAHCLTIAHNNAPPVQVRLADENVSAAEKELMKFQTTQMNSAEREIVRHIWNRVHQRTLKLAALVAVGCNFYTPVITMEMFEWSKSLVMSDISNLLQRFYKGEIGMSNEEGRQIAAIKKAVMEFVQGEYEDVSKYLQSSGQNLHAKHVIPYVYLQRKLGGMAAFRNDPRGPKIALKRTIETLCEIEALRELNTKDKVEFQTRQACYVVAGAAGWEELKG